MEGDNSSCFPIEKREIESTPHWRDGQGISVVSVLYKEYTMTASIEQPPKLQQHSLEICDGRFFMHHKICKTDGQIVKLLTSVSNGTEIEIPDLFSKIIPTISLVNHVMFLSAERRR